MFDLSPIDYRSAINLFFSRRTTMFQRIALGTLLALIALALPFYQSPAAEPEQQNCQVAYRTVKIDGVDIFFREAGPKDAPAILLLHGFPSSSHMFRNLIPRLADKYHVLAPDFPGYGQTAAPPVDKFAYTYDHLADVTERFTEKIGLRSYVLYLQDIGSSIGYRLAVKHPERVTALVIQNGEAYIEGINKEFFKPLEAYWRERTEANEKVLRAWLLTVDGTKWHYVHGARNVESISPDNWTIDQAREDRPGNKEIQLAILYDTKTNLDQYTTWQEYFRKYQPPTLVVWGKNDGIFTVEGAKLYQRDLKNIEFHFLDTGDFALEEDLDRISSLMREFLSRNVTAK
jgi:pimeloyl-ACP methyl ester carboxylesterase